MTINDIISKNFDYFHSLLPNTELEIFEGNTYEDILSNVILTAINKFKDEEIEEQSGYDYLRKTLLTEVLFSKRRKTNKLIFEPNLTAYDRGDYQN